MRSLLTLNPSIESTPLYSGCIIQTLDWRDKIETGAATIQDFQAWRANPTIDENEVEYYRTVYGHKYGMGLLALQCYRAELMTKDEMHQTTGIVW